MQLLSECLFKLLEILFLGNFSWKIVTSLGVKNRDAFTIDTFYLHLFTHYTYKYMYTYNDARPLTEMISQTVC
jgi:hypothetical protein